MGALNFRSRLVPYIIGLIEQKRALGYKYTAQVKILQKFDMLCAERFSEDSTVTKAMLDVWAVKGPEEAPGTLRHRVTVIAHLAQHIASLGFYAYIYPTNELPKEPKYNPYMQHWRIDSCQPFRITLLHIFFVTQRPCIFAKPELTLFMFVIFLGM